LNIFILDLDHYLNAKYHVDKHIVKMPLEATQMLCTASWVDEILGYIPRAATKEETQELRVYLSGLEDWYWHDRYTVTHLNHPCSIWARSSSANYEWLYRYLIALGAEYTNRYGKWHKSVSVALRIPKIENMQNIGLTPFAQAMPDQYKHVDPVTAYRNYYMGDKRHIAQWKRGVPDWWQ
jgi:hypothetical protein